MEENKEIDFHELSVNEQANILQQAFDNISKKIYQERSEEIRNGNIEINDISYNTTSDGEIIYDITITDNEGHTIHEFYNKNFDKQTDSDEISALKTIGTVDPKLEELEGLKDNPDSISLSELKSIDQQLDNTANSLGVSREEILSTSVISSDHKLKINENELNGESFNSNEKLTTHYNVRDVLGGNYVSYQIVKTTNGNYKFMGIDSEGMAEEIPENQVELINDNQIISLVRENGDSVEATMIVGFRIKSGTSNIDKDQIFGLCNEDGRSTPTAFYGRGALANEKITAENIPTKTYNATRTRSEHSLDTLETDNFELSMSNEIIEDIADEYDIDSENLKAEVVKSFPNFTDATPADVREIAKDLAKAEPTLPEHTLNANKSPID